MTKAKEVIAHAKAIRKYCDTHEWCQTCPFYQRAYGCKFTFNLPKDWIFTGIKDKKVKRND